MKKLFIIISTIICLAAGDVSGSPIRHYFRHIDRRDGLSQTDIKAIIQDSYGFMWFGTRNKLNRYDGNSIRTFDCVDRDLNVRDNNISSLFEDDNRHLWVGTDNGVFIYDPLVETFSFIDDAATDGVKMTDWVSAIKNDQNGNIWIVLPNQGMFRRDSSGQLVHYVLGNSGIPDHGSPQCMCIDSGGRIWIGTNGNGVYLYDSNSDSFIQYLGDSTGATLEGEHIYTMCDYGEELVIGVHEGKLRRLSKRRNIVRDFNVPEVHYRIIRELACFGDELWVGTSSGVYVINENAGTVEHLYNDPMCPYTLSDNQVGRIYRDNEHGIWVGTNMGGINYLPRYYKEFFRHTPMSSSKSISSKRVREMVEDRDGNIWIGTEDGGVNIYNPSTGDFRRLDGSASPRISSDKSLAMLSTETDVWVGFFKNGLDRINQSSHAVTHYSGDKLALNESSIYAMCEDRYGNVWIGNGWGVYVGNPATMSFRHIPDFGMSYIFDIIEAANGDIWVATMGNGVFRYEPVTGSVVHFEHDEANPGSLCSNSVSGIFETSFGELWFSTDRGGICRYNPKDNSFTSFAEEQGLPDDTAYKMLEDKHHNLWFGTNNGLVKFSPKTGNVTTFTVKDGLPTNQFNYKSALAGSDGTFYFGCSEGMISFDPYKEHSNTYVPPVIITQLVIDNKEMSVYPDKDGVERGVMYLDGIQLYSSQNNVGLQFSSLSFTEPSANCYAYKMDEVDEDWIYTADNHSVSYANLSPGTYTFHLKGSNNNGVWCDNETVLTIKLLPPWWRTVWAYMLYGLIFIVFFWLLQWWLKKRNLDKVQQQQRLFESEKEKELYRSKIDFFTQIAHEIRTPLTLINGPLESMLEMDIRDKKIKSNLKIMSRNTSDLMTLINQLLDFRKIDNNGMTLTFATVNVNEVLNDVYHRFKSMAVSEGRKMVLSLSEVSIYVEADSNAMIKVFNNLFSNAIKYSAYNISVRSFIENGEARIQFVNDGELIPENLGEMVFEPFYQMKQNANSHSSSGIGLSLARSLVEMQHGTLEYSQLDGLNCFTVAMPSSDETPSAIEQCNDKTTDGEEVEYYPPKSAEVVVIVEDNVELRSFLADKLKHQFMVKEASNGKEALAILEEVSADLVISDIMMPEMTGLELCEALKSNIEYSHIPVVLLTAKNDLDSKVKGLKMGAEAYIEKPFSFKHLLAQINSLFENRRREKEAFRRNPLMFDQPTGMNKADQELLAKIKNIVEENLTDPNFGVERLSEIVCMSRSSLHRKIKALSGTSPTEFVRLIRLNKSVELISEGKYRINEVCSLIGINSTSYFIKQFQLRFGMTPKAFEIQCQQASGASRAPDAGAAGGSQDEDDDNDNEQ